jgi:hypothetical protein
VEGPVESHFDVGVAVSSVAKKGKGRQIRR